MRSAIPENLAQLVFFVRSERVMLDADLARLYGVETGAINRAVKRNAGRFPDDFMFQFTKDEWLGLRYQIAISSSPVSKQSLTIASNAHGGRRVLPYAFTEQCVAMLSSVLRSARAVEVNIAIMRTLVQLRRLMD